MPRLVRSLSVVPFVACSLSIAHRARAHSVADVISVGSSQTPGAPSSPYVSDKLSGSWDPREWLTLRLDLTYTRDLPAPAPPAAKFGTSAANIFYLDVGADFLPDDHWTLSFDVNGSPRSGTVADSPISFSTTNPKTGMSASSQVDAQVTETSSSVGAIVSAAYDTAGEGRAETAVDASVSFNWFDTRLKVDQIVDSMGKVLTGQEIQQGQAYCAAHAKDAMRCSPRFARLLDNAAAALASPGAQSSGQFIFLAGVTETLCRNTDIGVTGSYDVYTSDPTASLSSSTTLGRGGAVTSSGGGAHVVNRDFGTGVALSPLWWTVRPEVTQRIRDFSIGGSFQYGQYVDNASYVSNMTIGVKLVYKHKFDKRRLKIWLSATGQRDLDASGSATLGGILALGAKLGF